MAMRSRGRHLASILALIGALMLAAPVHAQGGGLWDALSTLGQRIGLGQPAEQHPFLEPDRAFILSADVVGADRIVVSWRIADEYYLYRNMFRFRVSDGAGVTLGEAELPPGKVKEDEFFGQMEVYYREVEAGIPVTRSGKARTPILLEADFQGCAEAGFCYPPMTRSIELVLPAVP